MNRLTVLHLSGELDDVAQQHLSEIAAIKEGSNLDEATICKEAREVDAILTASQGKISRNVLLSAPALKVVGRFGAGYPNVDIEAATELGIPVVYSGPANADSVADLTFGLLLAVARNISWADRKVKEISQSRWDITVRHMFRGTEVWGKTLGIIGFGKIGSRVARRALGFDMKVLAHDPHIDNEVITEVGATPTGLNTLLRESDFVSIHTRCTPKTSDMISKDEISLMKETAYLINTAESGIVDEEALYDALLAGRIKGVATDVPDWELGEKYTFDAQKPLYKLNNCVITPVIAAQTQEARSRMIRTCVDEVIKVLKGQEPTWIANPSALSKESDNA